MSRPLLSITMPTRNRAELLERALNSVVRATSALSPSTSRWPCPTDQTMTPPARS